MDTQSTRRRFLAAGLAGLGGLAGCAESPTASTSRAGPATTQSVTTTEGTQSRPDLPAAVGVEPLATGFTAPVTIEFPTDDTTALVADQVGIIYVVRGDRRTEPVLDLRDRMVALSGYEERGLLGLAVHPDYPADERVFVRYSAPPRSGMPARVSHRFVLASFDVDPDTLVGDPDSERIVLDIPEPQGNHNAGAIAFGPDGYLYVATGDGGNANDTGYGHVSDWYDATPGGNGQDVTENLLGSILRIDVTDVGDEPYTVPDSNPLVGRDGLDEHYAWGFRNPWRLSFHDGELYAADVGQHRYEEVNHVQKGGNYGWNVREGRHCFGAGSGSTPDSCPTQTVDGDPLIDPVIEYPHGGHPVSGVAVIGGHVYTGQAIPGLRDRYVFADWQADGTLFVGTPSTGDRWEVTTLSVTDDAFGDFVLGFGRDPSGEVYVATTGQAQVAGSTGAVYRVTPA
ncbi:MAG: sorbosone dehydrogenase family protein [Halorhabdus sp.]